MVKRLKHRVSPIIRSFFLSSLTQNTRPNKPGDAGDPV